MLPELVGLVLREQVFAPRGYPTLPTPDVVVLDRPGERSAQRLVLHVSVALRDRTVFRFAKQHRGLNANQSTHTVTTDHWMWLCALAFWQLFLMCEGVETLALAWYPQAARREAAKRSPGQVQRAALGYLLKLVPRPVRPNLPEKEKVAQKAPNRLSGSASRWSKRRKWRLITFLPHAHKKDFGLLLRLLRCQRHFDALFRISKHKI